MSRSRRLDIRSLLMAIAVVAVAAGTARAELRLSVFDCGGGASATWTCTSNLGNAFTMYASVVVPDTLRPIAQTCMLDIAFAVPVPAWWYIGDGLCRASTSLSVGHTAAPSCVDYFGHISGGVTSSHEYLIGPLQPGDDRGGDIDANVVRLLVHASVDSTQAASITPVLPGEELFLFSVTVDRRRTLGTGACTGCTTPACATLWDVRLTQLPPALDHHESAGAWSWPVDLEGGLPGCTVATNRFTWGQVKSLYR